ncbi:MAG: o-succinylbenzoate synthase [Anaerolineae bacterium]|nr:o-succinylbenzoate synthase [Anaerolineae bacterium]
MFNELFIDHIHLHPIAMPMVRSLDTSFAAQGAFLRPAVLVEVQTRNGHTGWGEVAMTAWTPGYSYETVFTALHILRDYLIPDLMKNQPLRSDEKWRWLHRVRGHPFAKHALLSAIFSAAAAEQNIPLAQVLQKMAGVEWRRDRVETGISLGIQPTIDATLEAIAQPLAEGYRRIKQKIKRGWDVEVVAEIRRAFPEAALMVDANSDYTLEDADTLKKMDDFDLLMIEQPLGYDDIYEHSLLQPQLKTPLCLDESLYTVGHVQLMHQLGAGKIVNLKPSRVGGLVEAVKIHNFCFQHQIPVWVGGMLETGIGRAVSLALASLPGVTLPCDLSATDKYYQPDITEPPFVLDAATSTVAVPTAPGLGVIVEPDRVKEAEAAFERYRSHQVG